MIPEMLDPPEHRPYRQMLRPFFESKAIEPLEARVAEWTDRLLGEVAGSGECEFVAAIASRLPVAVFMELFGFPMERFDRSEEHTSELQSLMRISYAVFCLKKKNT